MSNIAISNQDKSAVVGYLLDTADFSTTSPNLPQSLALLGEATDAAQSTLNLTPTLVTSAQQAGQLYGFGSPIYNVIRILKPIFGGGIQVPITVYAQAVAGGAVAKVIDITPTGTATASGTHTVVISGRRGLDGQAYDVSIVSGDTVAIIAGKIRDAVNVILGAPVTMTAVSTKATATSKWSGLTSNDLNIYIDTNGNTLGMTYAVATTAAGSGTPSVSAALGLIGNKWETAILNSYGAVSAVMLALEAWNGVPDPVNPTGRFAAIVGKPAVAYTGSVLDNPSSIASGRTSQVTIAICPAPLSLGFPFEAAANMAALHLPIANDTPEKDVSSNSYPDMPTPVYIGTMSIYDNRNAYLQLGCSTVDLVNGSYMVKDFVTTYAPIGETPPQFSYVRTLYQIDMNVKFAYQLKEQIFVVNKVIANDDDILTIDDYIKPKMWRSAIGAIADDLVSRGLIVDSGFMRDNTIVKLSTSNPNRFNTSFKYKRSGVVMVSSTTAIAGFNFGV